MDANKWRINQTVIKKIEKINQSFREIFLNTILTYHIHLKNLTKKNFKIKNRLVNQKQ